MRPFRGGLRPSGSRRDGGPQPPSKRQTGSHPFASRRRSERPEGAARERALEVEVALVARDQLAQRPPDAGVDARELNHPVRERAAEELAVEPPPHLRRAPQLAPEVRAPPHLVSRHVARQKAFGEK